MLSFATFVGIAFAVLFFRAAQYERMSPALWTVASLTLSLIVTFLTSSVVLVILAQVGLFGVMWWYNAKRKTPTG